MSVATPAAGRLLCRSLAANSAKTSSRAVAASRTASAPRTQQRHQFHTTCPLASRKKRSPFRNVKAERMGLLDADRPEVMDRFKNTVSPDYDDTDIKILEKMYTPEQLEALMIGERVVPPEDLVLQGRMRNDPYRMNYIDDFSKVVPIVDKRAKTGKPVDTSARFMTPDEFGDDFIDFVRESGEEGGAMMDEADVPEAYQMFEEMRSRMLSKSDGQQLSSSDLNDAMDKVLGPVDLESMEGEGEEVMEQPKAKLGKPGSELGAQTKAVPQGMDGNMLMYKYLMERNSMTGFDGGDTALAPALPNKVPGVAGLYKQQMDDEDQALDPEGKYQELKRQTGLSVKEILNLFNRHAKVLVRRFVSNQTRLGKIRSSYVLAIAGNENGLLGMGEAKSVDSETATNKAKLAAIKNMQPIRRYENRTIYGNVEGKVGGTIVQLYTRPPGFGLRVSHRFFEIARAAGIQDLAAKMPRSRNPMNSVKACFQALMNQPDPEQIAIGRGKKLVDARKVYYGGAVY